MSEILPPILQNPAVLQRTSPVTRRTLEERAQAAPAGRRFLPTDLYRLLKQIADTVLPQASSGTGVDIAAGIDQRLVSGKNAGWRFAALPADGEAYKQGLRAFTSMLKQTPSQSFDRMPIPAREAYLRCVANGDVDGPAGFPLSKWLGMLRTDAVKIWLAHPSTMQKMNYYGFADGESGNTNGPTDFEGWAAITTDKTLPFEQGAVTSAEEQKA